jgi:hypothetical protein
MQKEQYNQVVDRLIAWMGFVAYLVLVACYMIQASSVLKRRKLYIVGFILLVVGYGSLAVHYFGKAGITLGRPLADLSTSSPTNTARHEHHDPKDKFYALGKVGFVALAIFFLLGYVVPITPTLHWYDVLGTIGVTLAVLRKFMVLQHAVVGVIAMVALAGYYFAGGMHFWLHKDGPPRWGFFGGRVLAGLMYTAFLARGRIL